MNFRMTALVQSMIILLLLMSCEEEPISNVNHHPEILSLTQLGYGIPIRGSDTLVCLAYDEDNDILNYEWTAFAGSLAGTGDTVIWFAPENYATYPFECIVTDNQGGYDTATMEVQVFDYDTLYIDHERLYPTMKFYSDTMMIITSEVEYLELWGQHHCLSDGQGNPIPPPAVDFDSSFVAAVTHGQGTASGCGDDVTFIDYAYSIRDSVFIQLTPKGWSELGFCFMEVEPRHWAVVPNLGLPIAFRGKYVRY